MFFNMKDIKKDFMGLVEIHGALDTEQELTALQYWAENHKIEAITGNVVGITRDIGSITNYKGTYTPRKI